MGTPKSASKTDTSDRPRRPERRRPLGRGQAQLIGWLVLAAVDVVAIVGLVGVADGPRLVKLAHIAYAVGQLLALGLVSYAVVELWRRWLDVRGRWAYGAFAVLAIATAAVVLQNDLVSFLGRQREAGSRIPWQLIIPAAAGGITLGAVVVGRLLDRVYLRWLGLAAGLLAAVANEWLLSFDYRGAHFLISWNAALLIGQSLAGLSVPRLSVSRSAIVAALVLASAGAIASLVVRPSERVWHALFQTPGAVIAPLLARVQNRTTTSGNAPRALLASPWFQNRSALPAIAPHSPPLIAREDIVIFVTIDAVRAELVNRPKFDKKLPRLHRLRAESAWFTTARTPTPSTLTTVTTTFTGKYYSQLYWTPPREGQRPTPASDDSPRIAELLSAAGVRTVHVIPDHGLGAKHGAGRGFAEELLTDKDYGHARKAMDLLIARLKRDSTGPMFVYLHLVDSHAPYNRGGRRGTPFQRYLGEVAVCDREIGRLRDFLASADLAKRTTLIVSADHGEAFEEHGKSFHATSVYEEVLRVPLLIAVPKLAARTIDTPVTLVDVGPTILDLFGVPTPGTFMGQSLVPLLRGEAPKLSRPIVADAGRRMQAMVFTDGVKVIRDLHLKTVEVYDLKRDPQERRNLIGDDSFPYRRYLDTLQLFFEVHTLRREGWEPPWRKF